MRPGQMIKPILPKSLFGRSLMIIITPLVLLQVVSTWVFFDRHWDTITRRLASSIAGDIAWVLEEMSEGLGAKERAALFTQTRHHKGLQIVLRPNQILPNQKPDYTGIIDSTMAHALQERVQRPFMLDTSSFKTRVIIYIQMPSGVLSIIVPGKRLFSSTTYIFVLWMVGTSLVLFAVASIFMRNQVRPIRRLAEAADAFGKGGEMSQDFRIQGATEVRIAATAFNRMRERINRQIRQRTDMLSGVSHDLRTPMTRMKLQLAMLPDSPEIENLKSDLTEMEQMIEGYLTFARGDGDEKSVETDLSDVITESVATWRRNGTTIDLHVEDQINLPLKRKAFGRCIDNLIANASIYGDNIWVRAGRRRNDIEIVIDDDGPGIPETERQNVFRPFYRVEESRNRETGGTGLGLAIARDIARAHGGDITLDTSPQDGLRARIRLPV
jgi:two-component system, OmpR family, osmolarity sensor histidine kinase EnvZ